MIETKSDMMRRKVFADASKDVAKNGFNIQQQTMDERLNALRQRQNRPKRKIPWITIISIASCLPLFMGGGIPGMGGMNASNAISSAVPNSMSQSVPEMTSEQIAQGKRVLESIEGETATISITIGDKVITKEVPVDEIKKAMESPF
jgi:hypothetical protein